MAIYENKTVEQVNPKGLGAYLSAKGWQLKEEGANQIWTGDGDEKFTIDSSNPDFAGQVTEILGHLEKVEARPRALILDELAYADSDILRVTIKANDTENHTLSIDSSVRLMQGLQRLLSAIAWTTLEPAPYLSGKKPPQVGQYIRTIRVGSVTLEGYSQGAISPLQEFDQEALARRIVLRLAHALRELEATVDNPARVADETIRRQMIDSGVSANMCDAVVMLFGKSASKNKERPKIGSSLCVEINIVWSPMLSVPKDTPGAFTFESDVIPSLQDFAGALRETNPRENFQFQGLVTDLRRTAQAGTGKIAVSNITREEPGKVSIELEDDLYELAIQAHRVKTPVICVGTLVKNNKSYELLNPSLSPTEALPETSG